MARKQFNKDATFDTVAEGTRKELSDLIDNIMNNISKLSNERDFFFDYFKNIDSQMGLKSDRDFVKGVVYKKSIFKNLNLRRKY
jgi:hypothetical protein